MERTDTEQIRAYVSNLKYRYLSGVSFCFSQIRLENCVTEEVSCLGKKKVISEESLSDLVLPETTDVFGVATKLLGNDRVLVSARNYSFYFVCFCPD